jgi:hypothetical protein
MRTFEDKEKEIVVKHMMYRVLTVGDLRKILNDAEFKKSVKDDALVWCESKFAVCKTICDVEISRITGPDLEEEFGLIFKAYNSPKKVVKQDFLYQDKKLEEDKKKSEEEEKINARFGTINALKFLEEPKVDGTPQSNQ